VGSVDGGGPGMSDTENADAPVEVGMSTEERAERQHDARFTVVGKAPEWAMRMFDQMPQCGQQHD
jgi:hypothetical protein